MYVIGLMHLHPDEDQPSVEYYLRVASGPRFSYDLVDAELFFTYEEAFQVIKGQFDGLNVFVMQIPSEIGAPA